MVFTFFDSLYYNITDKIIISIKYCGNVVWDTHRNHLIPQSLVRCIADNFSITSTNSKYYYNEPISSYGASTGYPGGVDD